MLQTVIAQADTSTIARVLPFDWLTFWTFIAGLGALVTGGATVALIIYAKRGLRSLTHTQKTLELTQKTLDLAQKDMVNRAMRESKQSAVNRCEQFAAKIIN